ncbi:hypothetical protein [Methylobacterium oryzae]|uniref:hypothetical protein n=1 Tax=Methylobacterium oryzae TaxID=334852 RepID=UPI001F299C33|nr:hypothetical protein [Methylobacterium oryzae]UIN36384.1 hypothetical protein LXM90_07775 [Methylobacterium oryzae]
MRQTSTTRTPFDEPAQPKRRPQRVLRSPHHVNVSADWILHGVQLPLSTGGGQVVMNGLHVPCSSYEELWPRDIVVLDKVVLDRWLVPSPVAPAAQDVVLLPSVRLGAFEVVADQGLLDHHLLGDLVSGPFTVEAPVGGGEGPLDRAQRELARLQDGWAGPESLAPLPRVLADLSSLLPILPVQADPPEFEVDGSDGTLALVWNSGPKNFSLILVGNGKVVGIMSPSEGYRAWTLPIAKEVEIAEKLEDSRLSSFLGL